MFEISPIEIWIQFVYFIIYFFFFKWTFVDEEEYMYFP